MPTSRIERAISRFRRLLIQGSVRSQAYLDASYRNVIKAIQPRLDVLYEQLTEGLDAGKTISLTQLYTRVRLEDLLLFLEGHIDQFALVALNHTREQQHWGLDLGQQSALAALDASKPPHIAWTWGVPDPRALANLVGVTRSGPLADLFRGFGKEAAQAVKSALIRGVSLGNNPRAIVRDVQQALGVSRARALVISRNESLRAYKSAQIESYRSNSDVTEKWVWNAHLGPRTCPACIAMHGTVHPLSEPMESHVQCRCSQAPLTKPWGEILKGTGIDASGIPETRFQPESGTEWFQQQDAARQREILGTHYNAWQQGKFDFKDIVKKTHSEEWGGSIQVRSLKELVKT